LIKKIIIFVFMKIWYMKYRIKEDVGELKEGEYPPRYIGTRVGDEQRMVYRVDGGIGLVWYMEDLKKVVYRWEHFDRIEIYK
jgi:hypothetical protein